MPPPQINAGRIGASANNNTPELGNMVLSAQAMSAPPMFMRCVVIEVIFNPKTLTAEQKTLLKGQVINPTSVDQIAANSVIASIVSDGLGNSGPSRVVLSPMFPSHLMLPVQAGEQVWAVFPDFAKEGMLGGKWVCRISEGLQIEDINFTHGDRRFQREQYAEIRTSTSVNRDTDMAVPSFPNGLGQGNTYSLSQSDENNPYDDIFAQSSASLLHNYEVVPRWTKRPQEFVLQGMNNSLVVLGQDRIGYVTGSSNEQRSYAGTVDIVAGRSRYILDNTENTIADNKREHSGTSPFVIGNERGYREVDKNPTVHGRTEQLKEGDPDFMHDAARIYVSMKTLGDKNFRIANTTEGNPADAMKPSGINYSPNSLSPTQPASSSFRIGTSYVINKADHIRLIGRRSVPTEDSLDPVIQGSVLLIKEGKYRTPEDPNAQANNGDHLAYMYLSPEGRVQIDGMQIFLGGAALREPNNQTPNPDLPGNVAGSTNAIGVGGDNNFAGVEPYIKWSEFKKVVEGLQNQIKDLTDAYSTLVSAIGTATVQSHTISGKDLAWDGAFATTNNALSTLNSNIATHRLQTNQAVYRARSAKIFGS
jgi:hypothetical protein